MNAIAHRFPAAIVALSALLVVGGCKSEPAPGPADGAPKAQGGGAEAGTPDEPVELTVYCGRSKSLVQPVLDAFAEAHPAIELEVRYGDTTELANTLLEEGAASPADVFFAQDAGALGAVADKGLFVALPQPALDGVDARFRDADGRWVGVSGRARVIAYNTDKLSPEDLPDSILGFADPAWKGRIGWPPTNASFHAFVTALRKLEGEEKTADWLRAIQANEPKTYPKNTPAVQAVANGEVDVAFVNHYYLHKLKAEAGDAPFPAANYHPRAGGAGAMMNIAGVGVLKSSKQQDAAQQLVAWLLGEKAQQHFATETFEYPLAGGVAPHAGLPSIDSLKLPDMPLGRLSDLEATMKLLRETKVLP